MLQGKSPLDQGLLPEVDADGSETSDCPSSVTSVTASNSPYDHADFMRNPMTFDALWRANLAQEQCRTDTPNGQEMPGTQTVVVKDTKDLELADEDRIFLLQVGIKP